MAQEKSVKDEGHKISEIQPIPLFRQGDNLEASEPFEKT
jgi:hypothetical protein